MKRLAGKKRKKGKEKRQDASPERYLTAKRPRVLGVSSASPLTFSFPVSSQRASSTAKFLLHSLLLWSLGSVLDGSGRP